jgi:hypothetical protein
MTGFYDGILIVQMPVAVDSHRYETVTFYEIKSRDVQISIYKVLFFRATKPIHLPFSVQKQEEKYLKNFHSR